VSHPVKVAWQASSMAQSSSLQRAIRLEVLSVGWALVEAAGSLVAGIAAGSLALVAFGADSGIEMVSAAIVLVQLRGNEDKAAIQRALKGVAILFFALALYVIVAAFVALQSATHPESSALGVILAASSVVLMPLLARSKASAGARLDAEGSTLRGRLLAADAAETALCAVLGVSTLIGVVASTWLGWWWADPIASLVVVYFAIREGREAWHSSGE
jgi:divalent metal cation (Fe/Co/Zn/Cd) transporter